MEENLSYEIFEKLYEKEPEFFERGLELGKFAVNNYIPQEPLLVISDTAKVVQVAYEYSHLFGPVNEVYIHRLRYTDERSIAFKGGVFVAILQETADRAQKLAQSGFRNTRKPSF